MSKGRYTGAVAWERGKVTAKSRKKRAHSLVPIGTIRHEGLREEIPKIST